jgi:NADH-quinone oxidoreductase subunit G
MGYQVTDDLAGVLNGKSVYVVGANPAGDDPNLAKALAAATFVVVQDVMETATTDIADVLLPAQAFTEREGTLTSGERRVQRFYSAVPPTGESRPDFAITAHVAAHMGINLEGKLASVAFDQLANSVKSFEGLNYARISETKPQWPIVGRGDMYYGGTTYENTMGTGAHLTSNSSGAETGAGQPQAPREAAARPSEKELLAVPVTRLYDRGTTVMMSANLLRERIGGPLIRLHPETSKNLGLEDGQLVNISFDGVSGDVAVKLDETVPAGVALVPREMGIAIREPALAEVHALEKVQ